MQQHLMLLRTGQSILKPIYNHHTGTFDPPEYVNPNKFLIVEGLLGYSTPALCDCYDVKVYLAPAESLRTGWKIRRDTLKRGYSEAQVLAELQKRESDSEQFIRPQRTWADLVVSFDPLANESEETTAHLDVKLVLRPTISHPDLSQILEGNSRDRVSTIRLTLDRDMGKPVDVLEIDAHATIDGVKTLARMICADLPELHSVCDLEINPNLGQITGTTGETLQSYPLALTQLLITYHMLKATQKYR
jgi:phosphoribulokinase